jgi:hypothetical protein
VAALARGVATFAILVRRTSRKVIRPMVLLAAVWLVASPNWTAESTPPRDLKGRE